MNKHKLIHIWVISIVCLSSDKELPPQIQLFLDQLISYIQSRHDIITYIEQEEVYFKKLDFPT